MASTNFRKFEAMKALILANKDVLDFFGSMVSEAKSVVNDKKGIQLYHLIFCYMVCIMKYLC